MTQLSCLHVKELAAPGLLAHRNVFKRRKSQAFRDSPCSRPASPPPVRCDTFRAISTGILMTDDRFFRRSGPFGLGDLARHIGAEMPCGASSEFPIHGLAALSKAESGEVSVFSEAQHRDSFQSSHASVVITNNALSKHEHNGTMLLLCENPRLAFAQVAHLFYPRNLPKSGIHAQARGTSVGAGAVIGAGVKIGERCRIDSNAVIEESVTIGDDCDVGANTCISHAIIGNRVRISTNVSIGGEGFGFVPGPKGLLRVPQLGRVIIEDDVEIGGNCAVDRGAMDDTVIGRGTAIDNLVQIAHNVCIGKYCVIAGQAGVAGSTTIGDFVMIGGQVAVKDHVTIGSHARIAGKSGVMRDVGAKESVAGTPAVPVREWHRQTLAMEKLTRKPNGGAS
jgi:UDP-3-O-[3-hydroxymyristoyl] glucosamine N-acyltransferase